MEISDYGYAMVNGDNKTIKNIKYVIESETKMSNDYNYRNVMISINYFTVTRSTDYF